MESVRVAGGRAAVEGPMSIKLTGMFLLLALMSFLWAFWWPFAWMQIPFLAGGLAFLFVATAYGGGWPRMIGKGEDGYIFPLAWLLYWPYFLLTRALFWLFRIFTKEPAYHQIVPGVWLGRRLGRLEARRLPGLRVRGVLDLTAEFGAPPAAQRIDAFLCLPVLDNTAPSPRQMQAGVYFIRRSLRNGPVYVHCALGHGRSATVVAAFLLATGHVRTVEQAIFLLKTKRGGVDPNAQQVRALEQFAANLDTR